MIRTIKALGLLTAAALAIAALGASAAQAEVQITAGKTPETHTSTNVHGEQEGNTTENYFEARTAGGASTRWGCTKGRIYGTVIGGTATSPLLRSEYEECGFINAEPPHEIPVHNITITPEGCEARLNQPTRLEENTYTGTANLVCPEGKKVIEHIFTSATHTVKLCTIEIGPQTGLGHIIYHNKTNSGQPDGITATATIEGIKYTTVGAGCPENGKTLENTKLIANITLTSGETNESKETVSLEDDVWISG